MNERQMNDTDKQQQANWQRILFATVPNSRITSWEPWFIFNLQKNKTIRYER